MTHFFSPDGSLNVAMDPADLPESGDERGSHSGALTRAKNVRTNEPGKAITRDGSAKLNTTAIETAIWWIEEQAGTRYTFAGTQIYEDESSIATGLTSAQWSAIKYRSFNDTTNNIFALNGTDRKRIQSSTVYEWGIAAPTTAPTLTVGQGTGLTGRYNVKYTYLRKQGTTILCESNPSPQSTFHQELTNQSLAVDITDSGDSQVTHVRLYRTLADGVTYYLDQEIPAATYDYGISETFEDGYLTGTSYKFTIQDDVHGTENTYTWEETPDILVDDASGYVSGSNWWDDDEDSGRLYERRLERLGRLGGRKRA